jgi:Spy/CpxP family protein refolding chaperone
MVVFSGRGEHGRANSRRQENLAMQFLKFVLCLAVAAAIVSSAIADETEGKKKGNRDRQPAPTERLLAKIELTEAQKEQVKAIDKEFSAKFAELRKAENAILTPEQSKAEREATKEAKSSGQKRKEARKAIAEAVKLTDEQKSKLKEHRAAISELNGKIVESLKKVLTPEQQEKLPKAREGKGEKGKGKKQN